MTVIHLKKFLHPINLDHPKGLKTNKFLAQILSSFIITAFSQQMVLWLLVVTWSTYILQKLCCFVVVLPGIYDMNGIRRSIKKNNKNNTHVFKYTI
jgi:hypothetical protein